MSVKSFLTDDEQALLRRTQCQGWSDDHFKLYLHAVDRYRLDPFSQQIHGVLRRDNRRNCQVLTTQTGIDGYRLIAERTGRVAGSDDAEYAENEKGPPVKATVTVWKLVDGQRCAYTASAWWAEYVPDSRNNADRFWRKMPHLMLGKVAEALALRKGFPAELYGLYTDDEMAQSGNETTDAAVPRDEKGPGTEPMENQPEDPPPAAAPAETPKGALSPNQIKRMFTIATKSGWMTDQLKTLLLLEYKIEHSNELTIDQYRALCGDKTRKIVGILESPPPAETTQAKHERADHVCTGEPPNLSPQSKVAAGAPDSGPPETPGTDAGAGTLDVYVEIGEAIMAAKEKDDAKALLSLARRVATEPDLSGTHREELTKLFDEDKTE
jgi:phage recombination protein Bet